MPKYILKALDSNAVQLNTGAIRPFEKNLLNLSALGIKWNTSLIKQIRTEPDTGTADPNQLGYINPGMYGDDDYYTRAHINIAGQNKFIAYYDQTYMMRRDFLRKFALQTEIDTVVETIADEVIVNDDMHYFAYPNTKKLRNILKPETGKKIVDELNNAYRHVYHMFNFNESNDAWHYVKKFLVDGFLAFEIIYSDANDRATNIIGFKELDVTTMKPKIRKNSKGADIKVWIINEGDAQKERELLDTNVIYISWAKNNFISHFSYVERLIRSFNMLRTLENSRIIWNIQNAQKRVKIVVPIGTESDQIARTRLRQLEAYYKEDINIDNISGEITVNGQPKFSFAKTMVFPAREGVSTEISEIGIEGHDMNSTDSLKWFWQRFMIDTKLPKDRFNMLFEGNDVSAIPDNSNMTREEYRFSLFINRIRDIFQEILIKPMWLQFCLRNPKFAANDVLKNAIGLSFVEENIFRLAKDNANFQVSSNIINTLSAINGPDGKPYFSPRFLVQKYLKLSDEDWALNEKMKMEDEDKVTQEGMQQSGGITPGEGGGFEFGGAAEPSGGFGGFGGGETGGFEEAGEFEETSTEEPTTVETPPESSGEF